MARGRMGQIQRMYFRIGEVSELVGEKPHVLRYWESEFRCVRPSKSPSGQRVYSRKDVDTLIAVRSLLKEDGYTIEGAKKRLRARGLEPRRENDPVVAQRNGYRDALVELRDEALGFLQSLDGDAQTSS